MLTLGFNAFLSFSQNLGDEPLKSSNGKKVERRKY
jgi:hypothetical protein